MAYPAGPLPDPGRLAQGSTSLPSKSVAFTGGGSDLDLTNPANGIAPCALDFVCSQAGNLVAQMAGDSAPLTYAVLVGEVLKGAFTLAKGSSTANGSFRGLI